MYSLLLVARHEYLHLVRRKSFVISSLAIPVLIAAIIVANAPREGNARPIGYTDLAGVITAAAESIEDDEEAVDVLRFEDLTTGKAAVEGGQVQALFVLPEGYASQPQVDVYVLDEGPSDRAWARWHQMVRSSLLAGYPQEIRERVQSGPQVTMRSADGSRQLAPGDVVSVLVPMVAALLFMLTSLISSGYLLQAVVSEKENRTMEVMTTSVTPTSLIGGKAVGLMAVGLTQLGLWILTITLGLVVALPLFGDAPTLRVPWGLLGTVILYFMPTYGLLAGIMIAVGSAFDEARNAQALSGPLTLPFILPLILMSVLLSDPNGIVATAMTLFPMTSFVTVTLRLGFAEIPAWQLVASWVIVAGSAVLSVWVAARVFRIGMLRYGQRLELRQIVQALRRERSTAGEA